MRVLVNAHIPDAVAAAFLQHLRNFDTEHNGCEFKVEAYAPNMPVEEMQRILNVDPPFRYQKVFRKDDEKEKP